MVKDVMMYKITT